jgi:hypothetical protein
MVLDQFPLYEADEIIQISFPHLIPLWIRYLPRRVAKFIDGVCSRENLCYLGTQVKYVGHPQIVIDEVYRPRYIDKHPNFRLPGSYGKGDAFKWKVVDELGNGNVPESQSKSNRGSEETDGRLWFSAHNCPSLSDSKQWLFRRFEDLLMTIKCEDLLGKEPRFVQTDQDWTDSRDDLLQEWEKIGDRGCQEFYHRRFANGQHHSGEKCDACLEELKNIPTIFSLSVSDTNSSPDYDPADPIIPARQCLILFKDELELILKNLQPISMPCDRGRPASQPELYYVEKGPSTIIGYATDAVCFREVPLGKKLRCKHE